MERLARGIRELEEKRRELWRLLKLAMEHLSETDHIGYTMLANATDVEILERVREKEDL